MLHETGRFGPYVQCTQANKPDCGYKKSLRQQRAPDRPSDQICQECGAPMVIKTGRFGEFLACTKYPKCKHTRPLPLGVKCPKCGTGDMVERRSKRGRTFFGCSRYPDCDFTMWSRPAVAACPSCGFVGAETRQSKTQGAVRRCLKCQEEFPAEQQAPAASPTQS